MPLPYKIATLLYCFDEQDKVLLLRRTRQPNAGLWSPPGGKLHTEEGESPFACACREAGEEMAISITADDLHLTGIVSEHGYEGQAHWLIFLFEIRRRFRELPKSIDEGTFCFFEKNDLPNLDLPTSDREHIWPLFWRHRGGFFSAHCRCNENLSDEWAIEQSTSVPANSQTR